MRQVKQALSDTIRVNTLQELVKYLAKEVLPVLQAVREAVNASAPCGSATFLDMAHTDYVTFDVQERDANYVALACVEGRSSGSAPSTVEVRDRTTLGFRLELSLAPGPGEDVTVGWCIRR